MKRFEYWLLGLSTIVAGTTGIALYVMKEWISGTDPFAVIHHPWQPWMLRIHLVTVPLLVFAFGLIVREHVGTRIAAGVQTGRWTGLGVLLVFGPMAFSGVLIQVLTPERWVRVTVWTHLLTGSIYLIGFVVHGLRARFDRVSRRAPLRNRNAIDPAVRAEGPVCR